MHQYQGPIADLPTVLDSVPSPDSIRAELAFVERRKRQLRYYLRLAQERQQDQQQQESKGGQRNTDSHN